MKPNENKAYVIMYVGKSAKTRISDQYQVTAPGRINFNGKIFISNQYKMVSSNHTLYKFTGLNRAVKFTSVRRALNYINSKFWINIDEVKIMTIAEAKRWVTIVDILS